jgi:hypothetical protein
VLLLEPVVPVDEPEVEPEPLADPVVEPLGLVEPDFV